jgi:hypothetical protein
VDKAIKPNVDLLAKAFFKSALATNPLSGFAKEFYDTIYQDSQREQTTRLINALVARIDEIEGHINQIENLIETRPRFIPFARSFVTSSLQTTDPAKTIILRESAAQLIISDSDDYVCDLLNNIINSLSAYDHMTLHAYSLCELNYRKNNRNHNIPFLIYDDKVCSWETPWRFIDFMLSEHNIPETLRGYCTQNLSAKGLVEPVSSLMPAMGGSGGELLVGRISALGKNVMNITSKAFVFDQ